ncbi:matrixin family metalloprotease [Streptomyces lydicus]
MAWKAAAGPHRKTPVKRPKPRAYSPVYGPERHRSISAGLRKLKARISWTACFRRASPDSVTAVKSYVRQGSYRSPLPTPKRKCSCAEPWRLPWSQLPLSEVESALEKAMNTWAKVSNLRFTKTTGSKADIKIGFYTGNHGDHAAFDGQGGCPGARP